MIRAWMALALGLTTLPASQEPGPVVPSAAPVSEATPTFAAPVRILAGEGFLGQGRLYPSPVFQDMNGDGLPDLLIGDLPGRLTVAMRIPGEGAARYEKDVAVLDHEGQPLKFDNW